MKKSLKIWSQKFARKYSELWINDDLWVVQLLEIFIFFFFAYLYFSFFYNSYVTCAVFLL